MKDNQLRELPQTATIYVSAPDSEASGDYVTIQEAINAIPKGNTTPVRIYLRPGTYCETVRIPGDKPFITLFGDPEHPERVKIVYENYAGKKWPNGDITGTFRSAVVSCYANHFRAEGITIENLFDGKADEGGGRQALAFYASGEHIVIEKCRFIGKQDTLYTRDGSQLYKKCYIEGDVDFIFGAARAVFDSCTIHSVLSFDPQSKQELGYVAAPSTYLAQKYGFVFRNCHLTSDCPPRSVYLGRPWHAGSDPFAVGCAYYVNCQFEAHIKEEGWTDMGGFLGKNARFGEYGSFGIGAAEHPLRPQLTKEEADRLTNEAVLGWDFE